MRDTAGAPEKLAFAIDERNFMKLTDRTVLISNMPRDGAHCGQTA